MTRPKKTRIPPFSLRLTSEERAQLEIDAAGMPLGAYIRSRLFDGGGPKRRTRSQHPVKDYQVLGQVLGKLGRLHVSNHLDEFAEAIQVGALEVSPDTDQKLQQACRDIDWIKSALTKALGLKAENDYDFESLTTRRCQTTCRASYEHRRE